MKLLKILFILYTITYCYPACNSASNTVENLLQPTLQNVYTNGKIYTLNPSHISNTIVTRTIFNGKEIYKR